MRSLFWLLLLPVPVAATDWFWRPNIAAYGSQDGRAYADAWSKETQIDWARMRDGDTLYVCGRHDTGYLDRQLVTGRPNVIISGNCPRDPGEIFSTGVRLLPGDWQGPSVDGVYTTAYSGSPGIAFDEIGRLVALARIPDAGSPCRSFYHAAGTFFYRPCGPLRIVYPGGVTPVVLIRHDGVTVEHLSIVNGGDGVGVDNARGAVLRHLRIVAHTGSGVLLSGRTSDGRIQFSEIGEVSSGIMTLVGGGARHDRWLVEGNVIHDVAGSEDAHAIGWAVGSDNVFRRNFIHRAAGSGITIYAYGDRETARNVIEGNVILDVVKRTIEANQRGIELSGDACWDSLDIRHGDVVRDNIIDNVTEGIFVKAGPGGDVPAVIVESNRVRAWRTGIAWMGPNGGRAPELDLSSNEVTALQRLKPIHTSANSCPPR